MELDLARRDMENELTVTIKQSKYIVNGRPKTLKTIVSLAKKHPKGVNIVVTETAEDGVRADLRRALKKAGIKKIAETSAPMKK